MKLHANAKACPNTRRLMVERVEAGWSPAEAAEAAGSANGRRRRGWRAEGEAGLVDRSSAPLRIPHRTSRRRVEAIVGLRRLRMTAAEIAEVLSMALSTVSAVLRRVGLGKRGRLEPPEPANRYEHRRPGGLLHLDVKKVGRIYGAGHRVTGRRSSQNKRRSRRRGGDLGREFVHVCVDDATRLAYAEVLADERGPTAAAFLERAVAWFKSMGIEPRRILSDNGACYRSNTHADSCRQLGLRHSFTRPYRPRTNGKAERFIQTLTSRWAHGAIYGTPAERERALSGWLTHYNFTRRHGTPATSPPQPA